MADYDSKALELYEQGLSYYEISDELDLSYKQVNHALTRARKDREDPPEDSEGDFEGLELHEGILKRLHRGATLSQLSKNFRAGERVVKAVVNDLIEQGYNIIKNGDVFLLEKRVENDGKEYDLDWKGEKIIRFGLCGDNQSGSKYTQWTYLHRYYDILEHEGIETVYHTGDITEGEEMRIGHKYECYVQGADDHLTEMAKNYPTRDGIETHFITGNHDHSMITRVGFDIGKVIPTVRPDMKYLGKSSAIIKLTPNCKLELRHPTDGTAYAISYKMQKLINAMQGGEKPNILAVGHYHKAEYIPYRNIHAIQTGAFQAQTDWMKSKGIDAHMGGWMIELRVDDEGTITRFSSTFFPFYIPIKHDYKNWD